MIGAGVSGLSTALYLVRSRQRVVLLAPPLPPPRGRFPRLCRHEQRRQLRAGLALRSTRAIGSTPLLLPQGLALRCLRLLERTPGPGSFRRSDPACRSGACMGNR
ncbi:FAD-dependent oxidoreductase [Reyranella massiliensis]|uniref:FAD-dependent oxidoreductase n=1 Tax=Reyranella massiliensis TaxID=445220 RepID=UPI003CCADE2C